MEKVSPEAKSLLQDLLKFDPSSRPTAIEALKHKFFVTHERAFKINKEYVYDCFNSFCNFSVKR